MCSNPPPLDQWASDKLDGAVQKLVTLYGWQNCHFYEYFFLQHFNNMFKVKCEWSVDQSFDIIL
jgi:hypothetical protein